MDIKVDTSELIKMFSDMEDMQTGPLKQLFREEFVLLIKELIKLTPPQKRGTSVKKIEADLRSLFRASSKMEFREEFLKKLQKKGGQNLADVLNKIDKENRKFINELPSKARHNKNRDNRGRVVRRPRFQVITKAGDYNNFKKEKVGNIGTAKAGWIPKNNIHGMGLVKAPTWLSKNKSGIYREINAGGLILSIENTVKYINQLDISMNITQRAIHNRKVKMMIKLKRLLKAEIRKINAK